MSTVIRNSKDYLNAETFRLKMLIYSLPGTGKTTWLGTIDPDMLAVAACDTGIGNGLLSIAEKGIDHILVENLDDLTRFCKGEIFPKKKVLALDSISAMARGFIKDEALKIPRTKGESPKRKMGVPELDDYGTIGEMVRRIILLMINSNPDKHVIVTATEKYDRPNENDAPGTESLIGPELAGQMFLAAPALFDQVLRLRTRQRLRVASDAKSRYTERYFQTQQESGVIAKCRCNRGNKALLDREEVFDIETGIGGFPHLVNKIVSGYAKVA